MNPVIETLKETYSAWRKSKPVMLSASLSYFATFSIIPFFILTTILIGQVYGQDKASVEIFKQVQFQFGVQAAEAIDSLLTAATVPGAGWASIFSILLLLFLASRVFMQLQAALNSIWHVHHKKRHGLIKNILIQRLISIGMVIGLGAFIFLALIFDGMLEPLHGSLKQFAGPGEAVLWNIIIFMGSLVLFTILFAMIFKYVPEAKVTWKEVWIGGFVTSLLFSIGKEILAIYFRTINIGSFYGATGSIVVLLSWIYFSTHLFIMGAQFTWIYSHKWGGRAVRDFRSDNPDQTELPFRK